MITSGSVGHPSQYLPVPSRSSETQALYWWKITPFQQTNSRNVIICCLQFVLSEVLVKIQCLICVKDLLIHNHTRQTASPSSYADQLLELLEGTHFVFPSTFFDPHCYKQFIFYHFYCSLQKWAIFVAFVQRIGDGNVAH